MGAERRQRRVLRAHREAQDADRTQRRHREDPAAGRAERAGCPRIAGVQPGWPARRVFGIERRRRRHLHRRSRLAAADERDQGRVRRVRADLRAGREDPRVYRPHRRQRQAVQARPRERHEDAADLRRA